MESEMCVSNLVHVMRRANKFKTMCVNESDLLKKCIYCKHFMNAQEWSFVMERHVKDVLGIGPKVDNVSGDGRVNGYNVEIKVSLGSKDGKLSIVQIRPDHHIDYYVFVGYDLYDSDLGKVHVLRIPSKDMYNLLPLYGEYSHGTVGKLGKITHDNIYNRQCEYSLRPDPTKDVGKKPRQLWDKLLTHRVDDLHRDMFTI